MQFLAVKKWGNANVFSDTKQKHVYWKFVKSEGYLAVLRGHIIQKKEKHKKMIFEEKINLQVFVTFGNLGILSLSC